MANEGTIVAHGACRVDLAGGTMDIWPLYLFHPGAVTVNFAVNILTRCRIAPLPGKKIRVIAQNVEAQLIKVPTGCQDYYPALYGGVNAIHLEPDGIHREAIPVPAEEIESRFVLAYTGAPRQSGINNWEVFQAHINGDRRVFRNFERIAEIARFMYQSLLRADWNEVARMLREEWKLGRRNAPGIKTPLIG